MADQRKVEVGIEIESYKVIHLLAVPLQRPPDLHEDLLRALGGKQYIKHKFIPTMLLLYKLGGTAMLID